jgi:hypothetical protein
MTAAGDRDARPRLPAPAPANSALRLSFHAAIAVAISPVSKIALCSSVICCSADAVEWSRAWLIASLVPAIASGDFAAIVRASASARSTVAAASGRTALTRPTASARSAPRRSPVYAISRATPCGTIFGKRCRTPRSAAMPIEISWTVKNASALQTRMSQAVARSRAPPMQPPWIAQTIGKRASSSALKQSMRRRSDSWKARRSRGVVAASASSLPAKTSSDMPAEKCLPVDEITIARVAPSSPRRRTASRTAGKNAGVIVFRRSGRFSCRWATPFSCESSKNSVRSIMAWGGG